MIVLPVLFSAAITFAALPLHTQSDSTARLAGTALSSFDGRPIAGVMVAVPAARRFVVTDSTGAFQLGDLPPGRHKVRIAYDGRQTEELVFALHAGKTTKLAVVLDAGAVDLAPVVAEVQHRDWWRDLAGFHERRKRYSGFARFYTPVDLQRWRPATLSQLLAREGIFTRCTTSGCVPTTWRRGRLCAVSVAVDGTPFWELDYDQIAIADVQGVEVYRSAFMAPASWGPMMAATGGFGRGLAAVTEVCGSVQVWTR